MIRITVQNEVYAYDMYHITKAFWPAESYEQSVDERMEVVIFIEAEECSKLPFVVHSNEVADIGDRKAKKRYVNLKLYDWLKEQTSKELAWGILTGVRPTKLMMNLLESGMSDDEVESWMKENYGITDAKAQLGLAVA